MRLTELSLEKYGGCASRELTIPKTAGLTVLYGANEAGKSTCLEAINDFLFSIPKNTQRGSLFGYDGMRIGATMMMADGSTVTLKRRKGNGKTLVDPSGTALDDTVLAPVLGAITRERFETLFGLNHETLRNGGERLLHADGDIGRLIVEAGGGLRTLVSRLEGIDAEADKLFDTRRSVNRVFYQQLTAFEAAGKTARGAQLTRETFEQTQKASLAAVEKLEALRSERRSLGASTSRLERVLRVAPHLRQLASLTQDVVSYDNVASFPDDFAQRMRTALDQRNGAQNRLDGAIERRNRLKARLDALVVNPVLKASEQRVLDLAERAIHVSKARSDRANRLREIDEGEAQLAALRRMLGLSADADISPLIPDQSALNLVRFLADEMVERRPSLASAKTRLGELAASLEVIDDRLEAARIAGHDAPPEASSSVFASLAAQKSAHQARQQALDTDSATLTGRLKALGFDTIDALATLPCPSVDDIRSEQAARETFYSQIEDQAKLKRQAEREITATEAEIGALQASGTIASDASLAKARTLRADAWRPIKSAYVAGQLPDDATARLAVADGLETAIVSADELADRRAAEAERAASLALALRRVAEAKDTIKAAEAETAVGDKLDLATLRAEWDERDLDEVRAELSEQSSRASEIESEIEAAILAEKAAKDDLAAYLSQSEVNHAVAEREAAAAQMHLALERYLELSVARELVTSAMATIRAEQQDPLIARAGELFTATTLGEFAGIETDIDDKGHPVVVGRRANGGIAAVATMSDGTRDQLFLAFRLASLENYAGATEPLPFIADDILVHFDDERSRSTLDLLAEFGMANQILLFTHHRSIRALAEPLMAQGLANIIDLD